MCKALGRLDSSLKLGIVEVGGEPYSISFSEMKELILLTNRPYDNISAVITLKDGREISSNKTDLNTNSIYCSYVVTNPISGESELRSARLMWGEISRLVFDEGVGAVRCCPTCGSFFHRSYLYCPYDKTKLVWSDF